MSDQRMSDAAFEQIEGWTRRHLPNTGPKLLTEARRARTRETELAEKLQRAVAMLKDMEVVHGECWVCEQRIYEHPHAPNCALAAPVVFLEEER